MAHLVRDYRNKIGKGHLEGLLAYDNFNTAIIIAYFLNHLCQYRMIWAVNHPPLIITMTSAFSRFPDRLQSAITSRLGWTSLRPVQELAGHAILDGYHTIVLAPTAGGKTEASMFPFLAQMVESEPTGVGILYIAPIKALLNNQADRLGMYTEMLGLSRFLWHGDIKSTVSAFLQRLGPTGRRGGGANTTFLIDNSAALLQAIAVIELARRGWVESIVVSDRNWAVLVQQ